MKRILIIAAVSLAALSAGCTGVAGGPSPATTSGGAPTSASETSSGLASIKPCDLLTQTEVTGLGLQYPGEAQQTGTADECEWKISGNGGLSAGIRTKSGIKDLNIEGDKISDVKIGKFDAKKSEGHEGAKNICALWISVTETSSVSIISNLSLTSSDTAAACARAEKAADAVVAKLP